MSKNPIEMLLDENNSDPIVLYSEKNEEVTFEQVAVVPLERGAYAILKPVVLFEGMDEDEALVFELVQSDGEMALELVLEDEIIDAVFQEYYDLLAEEGIV